MTALKICLTALLSIAELFILTKIMGKRQMSQLSLFDYIVGISIGSIAAEMATGSFKELWQHAISMAIYGFLAVLLSFLTDKFIPFRRVFSGKSLILMDNGKLYKKNFKMAKLDINEFLTQCRINGYFNPDDLQTVILEPNGRMSFLPKSFMRPVNPQDLNIMPQKETSPVVVISDGKILKDNLQGCGKNEIWLREQLKSQNYPPPKDIYLALCDDNNQIFVYEISEEKKSRDMFS